MIHGLLRTILSLGRKPDPRVRVLFVCMANVCRSPTAEAVFRRQVTLARLTKEVHCASAGTHDFYLGSAPDGRARAAALRRGYDMSKLRARQVSDADFERFDIILAMDRQNMDVLAQRCPAPHAAKLQLFMHFAKNHQVLDVPDPYFGSLRGFDVVLDMIEDACASLLEHIRTHQMATRGS